MPQEGIRGLWSFVSWAFGIRAKLGLGLQMIVYVDPRSFTEARREVYFHFQCLLFILTLLCIKLFYVCFFYKHYFDLCNFVGSNC